jgi:hypothetical protein
MNEPVYIVVIGESLSIFPSSRCRPGGSNPNWAGTGWFGGSDELAFGMVRDRNRCHAAPLWKTVGLAESDEIPDNERLPRPEALTYSATD